MRLSSKSIYGIRALLEMASEYNKNNLTSKGIAKKQAISPKFLEQIMTLLVNTGLVRTMRGPRGGCTLAESPAKVELSRVLSVLESPGDPVECSKHQDFSIGCGHCSVGALFNRILEERDKALESVTLQDMLDMMEVVGENAA
jgi:Rrf2 family protein